MSVLTLPMTRRREISVAAACIGLAVSLLAATAIRENLSARPPTPAWSLGESVVWGLEIFSCLTLVIVGPWLTVRLPTNPTGWWVTIAGFGLAACLLGMYSTYSFSPWFEHVLPPIYKLAMVIAVACWPTGHVHPRWKRPLATALALYLVVGIGSQFIGFRKFIPWPGSLPAVGTAAGGALAREASDAILAGIGPMILLVAVMRRRSGMPTSVRRTSTPAFVAAAVLGLSELWVFLAHLLAAAPNTDRDELLTRITSCIDVGRYGVVALLLAWSEAIRHRDRTASGIAGIQSIELGPSEPRATTSAEIARILGDPTARLVLDEPEVSSIVTHLVGDGIIGGTNRSAITIVDRSRTVVAVVEHDSKIIAGQVTTRHALMASVGMAVLHRARLDEAEQRGAEVRLVQRGVLDAQDRARRRLERDLHDGVQQRLVALAIDASLLARRESADGRNEADRANLQASINAVVDFCREILHTGVPGVLDPGLAAGLVALDAVIPLPTSLEISGDVHADHPAAAALWFVASEAVANSLKHAHAREIVIRLYVDDRTADLTVRDDGLGGVAHPPSAIVHRLNGLDSLVELASPHGGGTSLACVSHSCWR